MTNTNNKRSVRAFFIDRAANDTDSRNRELAQNMLDLSDTVESEVESLIVSGGANGNPDERREIMMLLFIKSMDY